jgi:predicted DNA-binding helix-hairpin-helix protein
MSMDSIDKLSVLSEDSRYDLACACGTSRSGHRRRGLEGKWLYPVALPNGGYSILLKTLLSNACVKDCGYCPLRAENDIRRCMLQPEEAARIFMDYYRKGKAFGLFLSSAVIGSPDYTMDRINAVARILRNRYGFGGYIHLKVIPGASDAAIEDCLSLASAASLNIETPGRRHFELLSKKKDYENDIILPLRLMGRLTERGMRHSGVKCTTQFIVGASDEKDTEIVDSMFELYNAMNFKRVYFSSYQKGLGAPDIPGERRFFESPESAFIREHRLYQVDFLLRKYGFKRQDIVFDTAGNLSLEADPKELWAERHPEHFPVRLNTDDMESLLRVPGIGPDTAKKILMLRRMGRITSIDVIGVKGKRLEKIRRYAALE